MKFQERRHDSDVLRLHPQMKKYIERLAWGTDAGFYRLIPEVVLMPSTAEEVAECVVNTISCGAMTGEVVNLNSGVYFPA